MQIREYNRALRDKEWIKIIIISSIYTWNVKISFHFENSWCKPYPVWSLCSSADCSAKVERAQGLDPESSFQTPIQLLSRSVIWSKCSPKPTTDFRVVALYFICNSVAVIVFWFVWCSVVYVTIFSTNIFEHWKDKIFVSLTDNNLKQICVRRIMKNNVLLSSVVYMMDVETNACRGLVAVSHTVSEINLEDGRSLGSKGKLHCLFYVTCAFYTRLSGILCCFFLPGLYRGLYL